MRDLILVVGDSWGCGVYGEDVASTYTTYTVSHGGLSQFLIEHEQQVLNLSQYGGSNCNNWKTCIGALSYNSYLQRKVRCIIVFQTEWQRDFLDSWHLVELQDFSLAELRSMWVSRSYIKLSELSVKYDVPIYIIGGAGDTDWLDNFEKEHPGLFIPCQSLTNLLVNDNHRIERPIMVSSMLTLFDTMSQFKAGGVSTQDKIFILDEIERGKKRHGIFRHHPEWFYPDGNHPNMQAHKKLFDHLCTTIPNLLI